MKLTAIVHLDLEVPDGTEPAAVDNVWVQQAGTVEINGVPTRVWINSQTTMGIFVPAEPVGSEAT